jgi:predicted XRE-type DNA-binding protein
MDKTKRRRLGAKGWKVGSTAEFLALTPQEEALIEMKLALAQSLRQRRQERMTQAQLAAILKSSQPRVAKAEAGDASVSMELLVRAMLATGATRRDIAKTIAITGRRRRAAAKP